MLMMMMIIKLYSTSLILYAILNLFISNIFCQHFVNDDDATNTIDFQINLNPHQVHGGQIYVSSGAPINATVHFSDEKYLNIPLIYNWSTKDGIVATGWNLTNIIHKFAPIETTNYLKLNVIRQIDSLKNETGDNQVDFIIKAPVMIFNPGGKFFLEHGELLNITLRFNGSKPFNYCYRFCIQGNYLPCDFCLIPVETNENEISITKYIQSNGNHTLYFWIENIISREVRHYAIKINDIVREQSLPIAPIASSILAVLILMTGITLHLHFKKTAHSETADFDFIGPNQEEDDWEEELSFIQRVKYIFCRTNQDDDDFNNEQQYLINPRNNKNR